MPFDVNGLNKENINDELQSNELEGISYKFNKLKFLEKRFLLLGKPHTLK